jgi:methionine-rich copper-binding protein CopC
VATIRDDGTGVINLFEDDNGKSVYNGNGVYSGTTTTGLEDDFDQDGITPTTEEALATLAASQGIGSAQMGDLNNDGQQDALQNALATLAWRHKEDFIAGNEGTLTDSKAIISIDVRASESSDAVSETAQLMNIEVKTYQEIDATTTVVENTNSNGMVTNTVTLVDGSTVTTPWDPIRFGITGQDTNNDGTVDTSLTDISSRPGTQVKVVIDVRASGLTAADANAYIKYVSQVAIDAIPNLVDLDSHVITKPGWYDFTQHNTDSDNDGTRFILEGDKIVAIELMITDNAFGDNDPVVGKIYDPGVLVKVTVDPVTPLYTADQTPGKVDFYGVTTGGVALKAWHNPITGDYFYAPEGEQPPYECYVPQPDLGSVRPKGTGVFDVHLYLNSAGDTQIMGEAAAAALGLLAQGYTDKGAIFASANATALDVVIPTVDIFSPADNAASVDVGNDIVLTFSEDITRGSSTITIHTGSVGGAVVAATVSAAGKRLTINPESDLSPDTHYFVTLADGSVMDLAGNHNIGTSSYDFTTGSLGADPYAGGGSHDGGAGVVFGGIAALGVIAWLAL